MPIMFDIIINPVSANGGSLKVLKTIESVLKEKNIPYEVHESKFHGHTIEIMRELNKKDQLQVILMGGDGTFSEALTGIENFDSVVVGFIPCGSGNDYAKAAKIPNEPKVALDRILANNIGFADFIEMPSRRSINCAGAGMDVDVLVKYDTVRGLKGKARYYFALFYTLLHLKFHKVRFTIDGITEEKNVFLITVANGTCIGGGMPISPESDPFDGLFNVVYINEIPKRKVLPLLLKFLKGKHIFEPCTSVIKANEVKIEILDEGKVEIDGEVLDQRILECKLISNKLRIFK
ncbi:MAG: YegS/Rv2252/BmrU family lipid kinase [Christensenellaceae bacterium]|jgi:YegS/Rv2252/BmrU family lipid kinase|nr:YegS/Rv2252/BmrU family lipid kinase [Christensenellaceae bacterium]